MVMKIRYQKVGYTVWCPACAVDTGDFGETHFPKTKYGLELAQKVTSHHNLSEHENEMPKCFTNAQKRSMR